MDNRFNHLKDLKVLGDEGLESEDFKNIEINNDNKIIENNEHIYIAVKHFKGERERKLSIWYPDEVQKNIEKIQISDSISLRDLIKVSRFNDSDDKELQKFGLFESQEPFFNENAKLELKYKRGSGVASFQRTLSKVRIINRHYLLNLQVEIDNGKRKTHFMLLSKDDVKDFVLKNKSFINSIHILDTQGNIALVDAQFKGFDLSFIDHSKSRLLFKYYKQHQKQQMRQARRNK